MKAWKKAVAVGLLCGLVLGADRARGGERRRRRGSTSTRRARRSWRELPGIGPSKAQAIVEFRAKEPFVKAEDLRKVKGIGDKLYDSIKDQVTVGDAPVAEGPRQLKRGVWPDSGAGRLWAGGPSPRPFAPKPFARVSERGGSWSTARYACGSGRGSGVPRRSRVDRWRRRSRASPKTAVPATRTSAPAAAAWAALCG